MVLDAKAFAWELRRFGGIVLQRSGEAFPDAASAREAGGRALKALFVPGLQMFRKERLL